MKHVFLFVLLLFAVITCASSATSGRRTCASHRCWGSRRCRLVFGKPKCVPRYQRHWQRNSWRSCARKRCPTGQWCRMTRGWPQCIGWRRTNKKAASPWISSVRFGGGLAPVTRNITGLTKPTPPTRRPSNITTPRWTTSVRFGSGAATSPNTNRSMQPTRRPSNITAPRWTTSVRFGSGAATSPNTNRSMQPTRRTRPTLLPTNKKTPRWTSSVRFGSSVAKTSPDTSKLTRPVRPTRRPQPTRPTPTPNIEQTEYKTGAEVEAVSPVYAATGGEVSPEVHTPSEDLGRVSPTALVKELIIQDQEPSATPDGKMSAIELQNATSAVQELTDILPVTVPDAVIQEETSKVQEPTVSTEEPSEVPEGQIAVREQLVIAPGELTDFAEADKLAAEAEGSGTVLGELASTAEVLHVSVNPVVLSVLSDDEFEAIIEGEDPLLSEQLLSASERVHSSVDSTD